MEDNSILDFNQEVSSPKPTNNVLNVFCILGYVSNAFWSLILLFLLFIGKDSLIKLVPQLKSIDEEGLRIVYSTFIVLLIINVFSILGLIYAHKRKKIGVIIYGIANGLWILFMLYSMQPMNLFLGVISIVFIILIALNYNK